MQRAVFYSINLQTRIQLQFFFFPENSLTIDFCGFDKDLRKCFFDFYRGLLMEEEDKMSDAKKVETNTRGKLNIMRLRNNLGRLV